MDMAKNIYDNGNLQTNGRNYSPMLTNVIVQ